MAWKPRAYTIKPNWKIGTNTEKRFCELMNKLGIGCKKTSEHVDKNYHVDFILGDQTPVDLKGNKNSYAIWLEKRNVWGGKGSLFGFAKYIVIDLVDIKTFVFYNRLDLVKYIKQFQTVCKSSADYYCLYTRKGNKDVIIKVREQDLKQYEKYRIKY